MFIYNLKIKKVSNILSEKYSLSNHPKRLVLKSKSKLSDETLLEKANNYFEKNYGMKVESIETSIQKVTLPILLGRVREFFVKEINRHGELYENFKLWVDENKNDFEKRPTFKQAKEMYVKYLMKRIKDSLEKSDDSSAASEFDFICEKIKNTKLSPERKAERLEEKLGNPFGFDEIYDWEPVLFAFGRLGFDLNLFRNMNITDGQKIVLAYHVLGADKELSSSDIQNLLF